MNWVCASSFYLFKKKLSNLPTSSTMTQLWQSTCALLMTKMGFLSIFPSLTLSCSRVTPAVVLPAAVDLLTAYTFTTVTFLSPLFKSTTLTLEPFQFFLLLLLLFLRPLRRSRLSDVERRRWPLFKHLSYRHRSAWHRRRRGGGGKKKSAAVWFPLALILSAANGLWKKKKQKGETRSVGGHAAPGMYCSS